MIPFSFQRELKKTGCEDAPPVAAHRYSVVCDGLGASGLASCAFWDDEAQQMVHRTGAYMGARLVSDCVADYVKTHIQDLEEGGLTPEAVSTFVKTLHGYIKVTLDAAARHYQVAAPRGQTQLVFPTTLASALYFPGEDGLKILVVWAGDSRVYLLTPDRGLQLLTLDDAEDAGEGMLSRSDMNNCVCQGESFRLNYAVYEEKGPCIALCCSDGCTDYLPSPLNFEWLLLNTIHEYLPDCAGEALGKALGERLREDVYNAVNDDTTMAGVCWGMDSAAAMKALFRQRMDGFGPVAVDMNETLTLLRRIQKERSDDKRTCEIYEARVLGAVAEAVASCAGAGNVPQLLGRVPELGKDEAYREGLSRIRQEMEQESQTCRMEQRRKRELAEHWAKELLKADYLKQRSWGYDTDTRKLRNKSHDPDMDAALQYLLTMIELYRRPELAKSLQVDYAGARQDTDSYLSQQIMAMESAVALLKKKESGFLSELWTQAYYSTDYYEKRRDKLEQDRSFRDYWEKAMQDPASVKGVSALTREQIRLCRDLLQQEEEIPRQCWSELARRILEYQQQFVQDHRRDIAKRLLGCPPERLRGVVDLESIDGLQVLMDAKRRLDQPEDQQAKEHSQSLWQAYRVGYERFRCARLERTDDA